MDPIFLMISQRFLKNHQLSRRHSVLPQASHHDVTLLAHGHEEQDARGVCGSAKHLEAAEVENLFPNA
jgi:hypothetical protein